MIRRRFLSAAAAFAAGINPVTNMGFAAGVRTGENRRNQQLVSQGLRIRDVVKILEKGERFNTPPEIREEILDNPDAVFIIKANIQTRRLDNGGFAPVPDQMERLGRRITALLFRKSSASGGRTFLKPNLVGGLTKGRPVEYPHGGIVHPFFIAGFSDGLHILGNTNTAVGARGGLRHPQVVESGLGDLFSEHSIPLLEAHVQYFSDYDRNELNWHECPEGVIQRRFCTYRPVFEPGTTFVNIAHTHFHWVAHLTLSMKNLQGIMPRGYGHICDDWTSLSLWRANLMDDFNPDYRRVVESLYNRHAAEGYKHWDIGGYVKTYRAAGGYNAFMDAYRAYKNSAGEARKKNLERLYEIADHRLFLTEIWAQRMMDIVGTLPQPALNIIEGVFARGLDTGVVHTDFLTVGRSMMSVDVVTSWMLGHDPRELPFLRVARERGIGENDIERIPLFYLDERGITKITDYRNLPRHPIGVGIYNHTELGANYF